MHNLWRTSISKTPHNHNDVSRFLDFPLRGQLGYPCKNVLKNKMKHRELVKFILSTLHVTLTVIR